MTTLIIILIISLIFNIYFLIIKNKYNFKKFKIEKERLEKIRNDFNKIITSNNKKGYYIKPCQVRSTKENFDVFVFVDEIDRYTNNKSKIKIDYIESNNIPNDVKNDDVKEYINQIFISVVDTNSITWLESVNEKQKERQAKLNKINNIQI